MSEAGEPTSLFVPDGDGYRATALARGPWADDALHGGPVAALLAHELSAVDTVAPMFPARLTLELFRPVGFDRYTVTCRVVRGGRRVQVLEAVLASPDGDTAARATLQQVIDAPVTLPDDLDAINGPDRRPPAREDCPPMDGSAGLARWDRGLRFHSSAVDHRARGSFLGERGPATDWVRVHVDLLPGTPLSPFERVAAAADFGNGISSILPFDDYVFVNPDLTIHLFRLPVDDWVCLDAVTRIAPTGPGSVGLAESALFDRHGRLGRSLQSLLVSGR